MEDLVIATRQDQSRNRQITWLLCIIASVAVLVCALHGLGMDEDSTAYLSGAVLVALLVVWIANLTHRLSTP